MIIIYGNYVFSDIPEILAKLAFRITRVVLTTLSKNIFNSRDNATFSSLLSIFILFPVVKCWGGRGRESEIGRV